MFIALERTFRGLVIATVPIFQNLKQSIVGFLRFLPLVLDVQGYEGCHNEKGELDCFGQFLKACGWQKRRN